MVKCARSTHGVLACRALILDNSECNSVNAANAAQNRSVAQGGVCVEGGAVGQERLRGVGAAVEKIGQPFHESKSSETNIFWRLDIAAKIECQNSRNKLL